VRDGSFREDCFTAERDSPAAAELARARGRHTFIIKTFSCASAQQLGVEPKRLAAEALQHLSRLELPATSASWKLCHWLTVMAPGEVIEVGDLPAEFAISPPPSPRTGSRAREEAERRSRAGRRESSMIWPAVRAHADLQALQRTGGRASKRPTC